MSCSGLGKAIDGPGWLQIVRKQLASRPVLRLLVQRLRSRFDPHARVVRQIEKLRAGQMLQPASTTEIGRYPRIIAFVADQLQPVVRPRVLSWGCSTGAELIMLRAAMPNAEITGVDINPESLFQARRAVGGDSAIRLLEAGDPLELAGQSFDAVFCMAVVRHQDLQHLQPESCADILPFAKAETFLTALAKLIRPGGLLALWNVHFRLEDMALAKSFTVVQELPKGIRANHPIYGPDNRRQDEATCTAAVYRLTSCPVTEVSGPQG